MDSMKYIGMDVHKVAISIAVLNSPGKLVMECIIETKAATILQFFEGVRGSLYVTFEEGTWAAWLYGLLKPHVTKLVVCNPRRNTLLKEGSKSDRIDARKLAELLRSNLLRSVYHGEHGVRTLKELARSYLTISNRHRSSSAREVAGRPFGSAHAANDGWRPTDSGKTAMETTELGYSLRAARTSKKQHIRRANGRVHPDARLTQQNQTGAAILRDTRDKQI